MKNFPEKRTLLCFAHRGASGYAPENTLAAIAKAIEMGADYVEIDVYIVEDQLLVFHDVYLERTTNGEGALEKHTLNDLRRLDAGQGQKIPLLSEVLDLVDRRCGVNVELKGAGTAAAAVQLLRHYIKTRGWSTEDFLISSFDHRQLVETKLLLPELRLGALTAAIPVDYAAFAEQLQAYSLHPAIEFLSQDFVDDAHRRRLKVFPYTINRAEELQRARELGVDGVFTNYPDLVIKAN